MPLVGTLVFERLRAVNSTSNSRTMLGAAAAAAADSGDTAELQLEGSDAEEETSVPSAKGQAFSVTSILEKLGSRRSAQPPSEVPLPLRNHGLSPLFWAALDAKGRHWLKRRCDSIKTDRKLACKGVYMALQQVQRALAEAGVERGIGELIHAVEAEGRAFELHFEFNEESSSSYKVWQNMKLDPKDRC